MPPTTRRGRGPAEFTQEVRETLAAEAGYACANPSCYAPTQAAGSTKKQIGSVGEAAHISAAAPGFARWQPGMGSATRKSAANGIWLCRTHAREIDIDADRHPISLLHRWKRRARVRAIRLRGVPVGARPEPRVELVRNTQWIHDLQNRDDIYCWLEHFLTDSGAVGFWGTSRCSALLLTLYELILNASQHGGATRAHLRARGFRIDLVHNGSNFNPNELLNSQGNGGSQALRDLFEVFGNSITVGHQHNGAVSTTRLIDTSTANQSHMCAVRLRGSEEVHAGPGLATCSTVHIFPVRSMSYSDGGRLEGMISGLPQDAAIVLHNTEPNVISHFKKRYSSISTPSNRG